MATPSLTSAEIAALASEDRGTQLLTIIWVFTALAIITVSLKLFTRAHVLHSLGLDDFFIFFSLALIIICTAIFTYDVHLGMGKHIVNIPPQNQSLAVKVNLIANPFGIMAYSFPNISVAILLDRLLAPNSFRSRALYALAISQCVIAGISCILLFVQCLPTEFLWNPDPALKPRCFPAGTMSGYSYFVGSYTALTDVILGLVPVVAFSQLQLNTKTKLGLCIMMGCTWFAAICAIVKTTKLYQLNDLADFTYGTVDLIIWAIVEADVIIIAACIPTLRPFFHKAFKREVISEGRSFFSRGSGGLFSWATNKSLLRSKQSQRSLVPSHVSNTKRSYDDDVELHPRVTDSSNNAILRTVEIDQNWAKSKSQA